MRDLWVDLHGHPVKIFSFFFWGEGKVFKEKKLCMCANHLELAFSQQLRHNG